MSGLIATLLEKNLLVGSHIYEPFAGGAAVSLNLLANGFVRTATWVERDPLVYAFWKCVKENPGALIEKIAKTNVTLQNWKRLGRLRELKRPYLKHLLHMGYAGLFFNRTCFSGIVGAGPIGGLNQTSAYKIDCRFNKKELAKSIMAMNLILQKVDVRFGDGIQFLEEEYLEMLPHSFAYIDPPYVSNGHKLYRYHFSEPEHRKLSEIIARLRVPWLLSYDNHPFIKDLYGHNGASVVNAYQSLKGARLVDELLFLSADFGLPEGQAIEGRHQFSESNELSLFE
jgi:DNA adenine methylase